MNDPRKPIVNFEFHEIAWRGFYLAMTSSGRIHPRIPVQCHQLSLSRPTSLFACLGSDVLPSGELADPILNDLETAFITSLEYQDLDTYLPTFKTILKRHEKLVSTGRQETAGPLAGWFTR